MAGAPIYEQWVQLHWERTTVRSRTGGKTYMTRGPFWVNKLSGESTWQKPRSSWAGGHRGAQEGAGDAERPGPRGASGGRVRGR